MGAQSLFQTLGLKESASIGDIEKRFLELVKEQIQAVADTYDEARVAEEEKFLREFHNQFFLHSFQWIKEGLQKKQPVKDLPDGLKAKRAAKSVLADLQKSIVDYAVCYMHLNRFTSLLKDQIEKEEIKAAGQGRMKWTSDTGVAIARYRKRKKDILHEQERMAQMGDLLARIDKDIEKLKEDVKTLSGKGDRAETFVRSLVSSLRVSDFARAGRALKNLLEEKKRFTIDQKKAEELQAGIKDTAGALITAVSENAQLLEGPEGKLFLRPQEISMLEPGYVKELEKIRGFLSKYYLTYMQHKYSTLRHLKDKLLVVGTLDGLMSLYIHLIEGIIRPLGDIKDIRLYENEVVDRARYVVEMQAPEVETILKRAHEAVQEFRDGVRDFEEVAAMDVATAPEAGQAASQ